MYQGDIYYLYIYIAIGIPVHLLKPALHNSDMTIFFFYLCLLQCDTRVDIRNPHDALVQTNVINGWKMYSLLMPLKMLKT